MVVMRNEQLFRCCFTFILVAWLSGSHQGEEAELVEKFSDEYRSYQQRTGRFIPRLRTPS